MVISVSFARAPAGICNAAPPDKDKFPPAAPITALTLSAPSGGPPKLQADNAQAQAAATDECTERMGSSEASGFAFRLPTAL